MTRSRERGEKGSVGWGLLLLSLWMFVWVVCCIQNIHVNDIRLSDETMLSTTKWFVLSLGSV